MNEVSSTVNEFPSRGNQRPGISIETSRQAPTSVRRCAGWTLTVIAAPDGGPSLHETKPRWQAMVPGTYRRVPDVAGLAEPFTGLLVGQSSTGSYRASPAGGTGLSTPIVAALAALAQADSAQHIGLSAPLLYSRATPGEPLVEDVRHVTAGIVSRPATTARRGSYLVRVDSGTQQAAPGWDPVTGLGTPGRRFLDAV
ncbi:hypothetical protein [Paractinoplanes toevensis]|uniref:Uncharacterized protein n=1 Tax=Paractinoplanes toevensis TaxID=571911 RepID=A0A919W8C9_9ACTN|nr:hypothetical protein [Actinoplanes toevensis]GIM93201.1 hypothetical protein Ato02nite_049940 [Actinoplanes toevensis]